MTSTSTNTRHDGLMLFTGIRYGEPPVGDRRFLPALPVAQMATGFVSSTPPIKAMQPQSDNIPGKASEDCLFLNIVTPAVDGNPRPVLFWIHGGGFVSGSAHEYDGSALTKQGDVVVVTINYRLGLFGFLDLSRFGSEFAGSASLGISDQILALQWVRDNIAKFGGDPNNVTIFGESAGGHSVHGLLAAPSADGLYHRAIAHSPGTADLPPPDQVPALAELCGFDEADAINELRKVPAEKLVEIGSLLDDFGGAYMDGYVITRPTVEAIHQKGSSGVPLIAGSNLNEGIEMAPSMIAAGFKAETAANIVMGGKNPIMYLRKLRAAYPEDDPTKQLERVMGDLFRRACLRNTEAASKAGPGGWLYRFDLPSTIHPHLGAPHAAEICFTFNIYGDEKTRGPKPVTDYYDRTNPEVIRLARLWSDTIIAFARTGDPNGAGLPEWRRYDSETRDCLILDNNPRIQHDPDFTHRKIWGDA